MAWLNCVAVACVLSGFIDAVIRTRDAFRTGRVAGRLTSCLVYVGQGIALMFLCLFYSLVVCFHLSYFGFPHNLLVLVGSQLNAVVLRLPSQRVHLLVLPFVVGGGYVLRVVGLYVVFVFVVVLLLMLMLALWC